MKVFSTIISSLDTPKSLIPFFVKDTFDNTGRTIMAEKTGGRHEARERFIEENFTSLFWIGGIPAFRAIANKIAKAKIDTDIHFKRINSNGIQSYFANELTETIKENGQRTIVQKFSKKSLEGIVLCAEKLEDIKGKLSKSGFIPNISKGKYKTFHIGVSAAAVLVNLFMLVVFVPMFNQFLSRKIISNEVNGESKNHNSSSGNLLFYPHQTSFTKFLAKTKSGSKTENKKRNKNLSFGSLKDFFDFKNLLNFTQMAENAQLNVTSSMLLLDYGISGSRVTFVPRDNNERVEYAVKEGGIILFFYYAADWIKKGFSTLANKVFKTPIDLDYKILDDKEFLKKLNTLHDKSNLLNFVENKSDELNIIKFIDNELAKAPKNATNDSVFDNFTLQMAQKSDLIDVEFDDGIKKWIRHSKKYIETDKLIYLNNNLKTFYEKAFRNSGQNLENIISKTKAVKAFSVLGNIAICCLSLSFLLPKIQYIIRNHRTKTNQAPGIKVYQDMAKKKLI